MDNEKMVERLFINKILKQLEKYLIQKNDFILRGNTYDLILVVPSDRYAPDTKYSLIISAKSLNILNLKDVIMELLSEFGKTLTSNEYSLLSRVNVINSEDPFVKNLKTVFAFRNDIIVIDSMPIGGVQIDYAYLVKSLVLDKLIPNEAVTMEILNSIGLPEQISAGIIRIERNFDVVYYTGMGLREIWRPDLSGNPLKNAEKLRKQSERFLMENHFIAMTNIENIIKIY